jgi:hypothetical protein
MRIWEATSKSLLFSDKIFINATETLGVYALVFKKLQSEKSDQDLLRGSHIRHIIFNRQTIYP